MHSTFVTKLPALTAALVVAVGCTANVNTNPSAPPTMTLKYRHPGGDYVVLSQASLSLSDANDDLEFICAAADSTGVSSVALSFGVPNFTCTVNQGIFGGTAFHTLPAPLEQVIQAHNGTAPTAVPLAATLQPPFTCSAGPNGQGAPLGDVIVVTCSGSNFSSTPTNRTNQAVVTVQLTSS